MAFLTFPIGDITIFKESAEIATELQFTIPFRKYFFRCLRL